MGVSRLGLRLRLVLATAAVTLVTVGLFIAGLQLLLARNASSDSIQLLSARLDAAAVTLSIRDGHPSVREGQRSLDQNLWIYDTSGKLVDGPRLRPDLAVAVKQLSRTNQRASAVVSGEFQLLAAPVRRGGKAVAVVVAGMDLSPYEQAERRALWASLALGTLAVLGAAASASVAASYSFTKVRRMAAIADEWREHDLHRRFALSGPRDELTALGETLDRMLDRIEQAIRSERRLTDEVAHELRTPLTTVLTEAQLARSDPNLGHEADGLAAIESAARRMQDAIATVLATARASTGGAGQCSVAETFQDAVRHAPARDGITVEARPADLTVAAPATVVAAILAPLIDNAVRHAHHRVTLNAEAADAIVRIVIDDDGAGFDGAEVDWVMEPGNSGAGGTGLGMALARRLANDAGGAVRPEAVGHGRTVVDLPQASPASR
jgi:signal transduction histidine kinase